MVHAKVLLDQLHAEGVAESAALDVLLAGGVAESAAPRALTLFSAPLYPSTNSVATPRTLCCLNRVGRKSVPPHCLLPEYNWRERVYPRTVCCLNIVGGN